MKIFFNSSMPRSGSTLLQNILGNNPNIYSTPTSGVCDMLIASKRVYTESPVFKAQDTEEMKKAFLTYCRYGIEGYFAGITDRKYVVDKSRAWAINAAFLDGFYPEPKIICMVRDLCDIVASMEKNFRRFPDKWDVSQDNANPKGLSVEQRVGIWLDSKTPPVGITLIQLKDAIHRGFAKHIHFVKFEDLNSNPDDEMRKVYEFLEVPYYKHDFNNIQQVTHEDDKFHGRYGDHKIKPVVKPVPSFAIELLGKFTCEKIYENNKWYFEYFNYKK